MTPRRSDRIFAALGVGFVATSLAGTVLGADVHGSFDNAAKAAAKIATPLSPHVWVGGYLEMLSVGCFLAFAAWATARLGGGVLAQLARTAAAAYAADIVASLGLMYGLGDRFGHGLTVPVARAIDAVNEATYVGSWFLTAFFLLAIGALAVGASRRVLGWSSIGIGVATLAAVPSLDNLGQLSVLLFFGWVLGCSIALVRSPRGAPAPAVAPGV
jgi:hypothetical protein